MPKKPSWTLEHSLWLRGHSPVAGIDEAGRGALAGPVVAAAVILPHKAFPFNDSKALSAQAREEMALHIKEEALAWGVGLASAKEVDDVNVLAATHVAAKRALAQLVLTPQALVTDYLFLKVNYPVVAVPKGDAISLQIAAASILAKTTRDKLMTDLHADYPHYGFVQNKGYGSVKHLNALDSHGVSPIHRLSYKPVAQRRLFPAGK